MQFIKLTVGNSETVFPINDHMIITKANDGCAVIMYSDGVYDKNNSVTGFATKVTESFQAVINKISNLKGITVV